MTPRSILRIHRWIALAFAPLLLLQAMTGSVLLFRDPLTRILGPETSSSTNSLAPVSHLVESAEAAQPGMRMVRLFFPGEEGDAAFAQMGSEDGAIRYAALDPIESNVLSSGRVWNFPVEAALQIHYQLLSGWIGLAIVTVNGIALCMIALSGAWYWWPGWGRITSSLKINVKIPSRLRLRAWHRRVGPVAAILLLFSGSTGLLLAVSDLPPLFQANSAFAEPVRLTGSQIDAAIAAGQVEFPGARIRDIRFATNGTIEINFFAPREGKRSVDVATISGTRGEVISTLAAEENPAVWLTILPLHAGDPAGTAGRLLLLAEAAAIVFLVISGPMAWWRSRRDKKRVAKQRTNDGTTPSR